MARIKVIFALGRFNQIDFNLFALTCLNWNVIVIEKEELHSEQDKSRNSEQDRSRTLIWNSEQDKSKTWIWTTATWDCCNLVDSIRNVLSFPPQASLVVEHFWSFGLFIFNLFVFYSLIVWCFTLWSIALLISNLLLWHV